MADEARTPAIATYHEWMGDNADIQEHTRKNALASLEAQGGDMEDIAVSLHFHPSQGRWFFASAPITN